MKKIICLLSISIILFLSACGVQNGKVRKFKKNETTLNLSSDMTSFDSVSQTDEGGIYSETTVIDAVSDTDVEIADGVSSETLVTSICEHKPVEDSNPDIQNSEHEDVFTGVYDNNRLPEVNFSIKNSNHRFTDIVNLSNGGFAVAGHWSSEVKPQSIIQFYDENAVFEKEYTHYSSDGIDALALCSDGGFIVASSLHIIKISSDLEEEWSVECDEISQFRCVYDVEEINSNCYAVAFASFDQDMVMKLKIAFLDKSGEIIETIDVVLDIFQTGTEMIPDGSGGFYLFTTCNKSAAEKYPLVAINYDSSKAEEAIIMHYSAERELVWVKTFGGGGEDWIEEATIDDNGNFYLAVGTNWENADSFWDMSVERTLPFRRMLVKLDKNGDLVYKVPLSAKGMAVDQVFGIHIEDGKTYVVGMADYFDGYQIKYSCEQILPEEKQKEERVFCVYNACIDSNGQELDRKIFKCNVHNMPCDSVLLSNGSIVVAGKVSSYDNPFNLEFPLDVDSIAALYIFKGEYS